MTGHTSDESISFTSGTDGQSGVATIAGTFTAPAEQGPHPTALILAGSGPLDRNGNHGKLALNVSGLLADAFAQHGWASLRFDKRGVGESTGDYLPTGFFDELADAAAALAYLEERTDVDRIVVVGHSAGAIQAGELAARHPGVSGAVLLSTSAKRGGDTLRWQANEMQDTIVPAPIRALLRLFRTSVVKQQARNVARIEATTGDVARIQLVKVNAKWMREFIAHDPLPALRQAQAPLLALTGAKDVQVDPGDIATILESAPDGTEGYVIPDVDHILRHEAGEISNPRFYKRQVSKQLDGRVVSAIIDWLEALPANTSAEHLEA